MNGTVVTTVGFGSFRLQDRPLARIARRCRCAALVPALVSVLAMAAMEAAARDLKQLSELLAPAYTAMSYAGLCSTEQGWNRSQPRGTLGAAVNYAEHIKDEVIASLSREEAMAVLIAAADEARSRARGQLKDKVIASDKVEEAARFHEWCDGHASRFIRSVIRGHDGDYAAFHGHIDAAKSWTAPLGVEH